MDHERKDGVPRNNSPASRNTGISGGSNNDENGNASSDMNEVDFDKNSGDYFHDGPQDSEKRKVRKKKICKASPKLLIDKKKLQQYVGEGEVLVPVPRARRRLKSNELGYMVKRDDVIMRYIDKDGIVYNPNGESKYCYYDLIAHTKSFNFPPLLIFGNENWIQFTSICSYYLSERVICIKKSISVEICWCQEESCIQWELLISRRWCIVSLVDVWKKVVSGESCWYQVEKECFWQELLLSSGGRLFFFFFWGGARVWYQMEDGYFRQELLVLSGI